MKKAKKPKTMKMLIKKIAVVACAATLAFSMIPATVQAAGWKQNKNGYWWRKMIIVIQEISGKLFMENSTTLIPVDIWILAGQKWMADGIIWGQETTGQRKLTGKKCMENTIGLEVMV